MKGTDEHAEHPVQTLCEQCARKRPKLEANLAEQGVIECKLKDVDVPAM